MSVERTVEEEGVEGVWGRVSATPSSTPFARKAYLERNNAATGQQHRRLSPCRTVQRYLHLISSPPVSVPNNEAALVLEETTPSRSPSPPTRSPSPFEVHVAAQGARVSALAAKVKAQETELLSVLEARVRAQDAELQRMAVLEAKVRAHEEEMATAARLRAGHAALEAKVLRQEEELLRMASKLKEGEAGAGIFRSASAATTFTWQQCSETATVTTTTGRKPLKEQETVATESATREQATEQESIIREREVTIREQEGTIREKEGKIREQESTIREQEARIEEQEAELKRHASVVDAGQGGEEVVRVLLERVAGLEAKADAQEVELWKKNEELARLRRENADLHAAAARSEEETVEAVGMLEDERVRRDEERDLLKQMLRQAKAAQRDAEQGLQALKSHPGRMSPEPPTERPPPPPPTELPDNLLTRLRWAGTDFAPLPGTLFFTDLPDRNRGGWSKYYLLVTAVDFEKDRFLTAQLPRSPFSRSDLEALVAADKLRIARRLPPEEALQWKTEWPWHEQRAYDEKQEALAAWQALKQGF